MQEKLILTPSTSIALDLLRALAAQAVVFGHGFRLFGVYHDGAPVIQNLAVLVFFVLSGFLISMSLYNKTYQGKQYPFKAYFIDRFSRIYSGFLPVFLVVIAVDFISSSINDIPLPGATGGVQFIGNLFMLQDFPLLEQITSYGSGRPFWTLAIEWWIYLAVGFAVLQVRRKVTVLNVVVLGLLSIVPVYNLFGGRGNALTLTWFIGAAILPALLMVKPHRKQRLFALLLAALFLATAVARYLTTFVEYEVTLAALLSLALFCLVFFTQTTSLKLLERFEKPIRFIAEYSYTLYLLHFTLIVFLRDTFGANQDMHLLFWVAVVLANVVSIVLALPFEMRHRKFRTYLKNRFI